MTPLAEITDYNSLLAALRARADQLECSRETIDYIAGLPANYAAKVLSLSHVRRIGMSSLGLFLDALGMKLVAVPDDAAVVRALVAAADRQAGGLPLGAARGDLLQVGHRRHGSPRQLDDHVPGLDSGALARRALPNRPAQHTRFVSGIRHP